MNTIIRHQAVNIVRIAAGSYSLKNVNGDTIAFTRLLDAKNFVNAHWGQALIEAQFTN